MRVNLGPKFKNDICVWPQKRSARIRRKNSRGYARKVFIKGRRPLDYGQRAWFLWANI